jgi:hypothetical protein
MQKLTSSHCKLTFYFLFFIVLGSKVFAQSPLSQGNEQNKLQIPFNHHIEFNQLGLHSTDSFDWEIRNKNNEVIANQNLGNISSYVFTLPGEYELSITNITEQQPSECNHSRLPLSWEIRISPFDVTFDVQNLSFSKSLTTENLQSSLTLIVPVSIGIHSDFIQLFDLQELKVMVQGVGCAITVTQSGQENLVKTGLHNLQFTLKGNSIKQSYIMIDFIDQNGTITTYYHPQSL